MVIRIEQYYRKIPAEIKRGMTIEYQKCKANLNFNVDFVANGAIVKFVTKWDSILFR